MNVGSEIGPQGAGWRPEHEVCPSTLGMLGWGQAGNRWKVTKVSCLADTGPWKTWVPWLVATWAQLWNRGHGWADLVQRENGRQSGTKQITLQSKQSRKGSSYLFLHHRNIWSNLVDWLKIKPREDYVTLEEHPLWKKKASFVFTGGWLKFEGLFNLKELQSQITSSCISTAGPVK